MSLNLLTQLNAEKSALRTHRFLAVVHNRQSILSLKKLCKFSEHFNLGWLKSHSSPDSTIWQSFCVVCCMWWQITGSMFHHNTVNLNQHIRNILHQFLNSWLKTKNNAATFNMIMLLCILHEIHCVHYKRCLMTESLVQVSGLQDSQILVFATFIYGGQEHISHYWSS